MEAGANTETTPSDTAPQPQEPKASDLRSRIRYFLVHNILHLDDTPHRIALGVLLGLVIGCTPTLGIQTLMYFAFASVMRANMVSGLGLVWLTNPVTAVPFYYACWRVGGLLLTGRLETSPESQAAIARLIEGSGADDTGFYERIFQSEFWVAAIELLRSIGLELWVGCTFVGLLSGGIGYWLTYRAVVAYRAHRAQAEHSNISEVSE